MIRTRFAPSPTGSLHIGGLRSALYPYAFAKHGDGNFILRIEDTDQKREVSGSKEKIGELLKLFGINWDEYFVQSERLDVYKRAAEKLVKEGHAYEDEGAIRLKIPRDEKISYHDFVLDKDVEWDTNILEELVLLKSDGFPTYHLAAMTDEDRKSTRLNSSHQIISYAVFCLKKKKKNRITSSIFAHITICSSSRPRELPYSLHLLESDRPTSNAGPSYRIYISLRP